MSVLTAALQLSHSCLSFNQQRSFGANERVADRAAGRLSDQNVWCPQIATVTQTGWIGGHWFAASANEKLRSDLKQSFTPEIAN